MNDYAFWQTLDKLVGEWRSDEKWFSQSVNSLDDFNNRVGVHIIDTSNLSPDMVADRKSIAAFGQ